MRQTCVCRGLRPELAREFPRFHALRSVYARAHGGGTKSANPKRSEKIHEKARVSLALNLPDFSPEWALGASLVLSLAAWLKGSLSPSGFLAAWLVGSAIGVGLGWGGFAVVCVFFATSTLLGRVGKDAKEELQAHYSKGDRRDAWQVFANGGVAASCALLVWLQRGTLHNSELNAAELPLTLAACASLASANADTWATELGVLSRSDPVHLLRWQRVPRGTSGAVSLLGLVVAAAGALCIGCSAAVLLPTHSVFALLVIASAGWLGALLDSVLGAALQAQQRCVECQRVVEAAQHCGRPTEAWGPRYLVLNNDHVNLAANALAGLLACGVAPAAHSMAF